jgi:membrane protein DedA with SNARE-associated domain
MTEFIESVGLLISNHHSIQYIIVFFGSLVGGEPALFALGFLVAEGVLQIEPILFIVYIGAFLPNLLWFLLGNSKFFYKIASHRYLNTTFLTITEAIVRVSRGSHLIAFLIMKFMIGTQFLLIIYVNKMTLSLKQFFYYQLIVASLSVGVVMTMGYYAGRWFGYLKDVFQNLYAGIGFILLILVCIVMFQIWIEKKVVKKID